MLGLDVYPYPTPSATPEPLTYYQTQVISGIDIALWLGVAVAACFAFVLGVALARLLH